MNGNGRAVVTVETDPVSTPLPEGVSHLLIADDALIPSRWGSHVTLCGLDVTITFDMSGTQWRRTGNRDPIQVAQHAPTQRERPHLLRAKVGPFVAHWVSRLRRLILRR